MKQARAYHISIRCYFPDGGFTQHHQVMPLSDIKRWIESYEFTHPTVESISFRMWPKDKEVNELC